MLNNNNALIVEDDISLGSTYKDVVSNYGFSVTNAYSIASAQETFEQLHPKLVILDLRLPDGNGLDFFKQYSENKSTKFIIITGHADVATAVESIKKGVREFIVKPISLEKLKTVITSLKNELDDETKVSSNSSYSSGKLLSKSAAMIEVKSQADKVASMPISVLIQGESGVGKEVIAQYIHKESGRSGAFIPVNCGSISPELISSELFGHEKGSFTGAHKSHSGYFEQAQGGTLFLDEVTEMSKSAQVYLLRVLESKQIKKVGGTKFIEIDVRILAASNRNVQAAVSDGRFREDLFYRLGQYLLKLPPLRERTEDIVPLANLFLNQLNCTHKKEKYFSSDYVDSLKQYHWPGNVRQLRNAVLRSYILSDMRIEACVLDVCNNESNNSELAIKELVGYKVVDVEKELILNTLRQCNNKKPEAAKMLGISLKTLYNKLSYINN